MQVNVETREGGYHAYTYYEISALKFSPEVDIYSNTVPLGKLSCKIKDIRIQPRFGDHITLRDSYGNLWARYVVTQSLTQDDGFTEVVAVSKLHLLDYIKMPPRMYGASVDRGVKLYDALIPIFTNAIAYTVDATVAAIRIKGYAPEQTARQRLQWLLAATGCYVIDAFSRGVRIKPIGNGDEEPTPIEIGKVYWRPTYKYQDYVTSTSVTYYEYEEREPAKGEKYVDVETNGTLRTYVQTEEKATLINPRAPEGAPEKVVELKNVTVIGLHNYGTILNGLALRYFDQRTMSCDVINNGEYQPGQWVAVQVSESKYVAGYIKSCDFSFGTQSKSKLELTGLRDMDAGILDVRYMFQGSRVGRRIHALPVGCDYDIPHPYLTVTTNRHVYVLRPPQDRMTGTVRSGKTVITVTMYIALDLYENDLHIVSVDEAEKREGTMVIK